MSNVIDLAAYRTKREQEQERDLNLQQRREYDRAVQQSRQLKPSPMWGIFVTTYQLLIKPTRKDE